MMSHGRRAHRPTMRTIGDVTMRLSSADCARFAASRGECIMGQFRSEIGQNADRWPRGRSLYAGNSHIIRMVLSIIAICRDSGVRTTLAAPFAAASARGPEVRTTIAASPSANFGFKSGTRIIVLLVSFDSEVRDRACGKLR